MSEAYAFSRQAAASVAKATRRVNGMPLFGPPEKRRRGVLLTEAAQAWRFARLGENYQAVLLEDDGSGGFVDGEEVEFDVPPYVSASDLCFVAGLYVKLVYGYQKWWLDGAGCDLLCDEEEESSV